MTFKNKSMQVVEVFVYQDLDFQEFKKQIEAQKMVPMVGCNEVKYKDGSGKICYKQIENADLLDFSRAQLDKK